MNPLFLGGVVVAVVGGVAYLLMDSEPPAPAPSGAWPPGATKEAQRLNAAGIWTMGMRLVDAGVIDKDTLWFLVAKGYTESRWSWKAGSSAQSNAARGMWGLRPKSAWDEPDMAKLSAAQVAAVKDPVWAMATALDYLYRVMPYVSDGEVNAREMACGWAFPSYAASVEQCKAKRPALIRRWELALKKTGLPLTFDPVLDVNWPGLAEAAAIIKG